MVAERGIDRAVAQHPCRDLPELVPLRFVRPIRDDVAAVDDEVRIEEGHLAEDGGVDLRLRAVVAVGDEFERLIRLRGRHERTRAISSLALHAVVIARIGLQAGDSDVVVSGRP